MSELSFVSSSALGLPLASLLVTSTSSSISTTSRLRPTAAPRTPEPQPEPEPEPNPELEAKSEATPDKDEQEEKEAQQTQTETETETAFFSDDLLFALETSRQSTPESVLEKEVHHAHVSTTKPKKEKEKESQEKKPDVMYEERTETETEEDEEEEEEEGASNLVIDNGCDSIKVGVSGEELPLLSVSNILGKAKYRCELGTGKQVFIGDDALVRRGVLTLQRPMRKGLIENWSALELIWQHSIQQTLRLKGRNEKENDIKNMQSSSDEEEIGKLLMSEVAFNPRKTREKTTQIVFESLDASHFFLELAPVLALYEQGWMTGVTCDVGHEVSTMMPVLEGTAVLDWTMRQNLAGRHVSDYLRHLLLAERAVLMSSASELQIVREIKEQLCYVSMDFACDMAAQQPELAAAPAAASGGRRRPRRCRSRHSRMQSVYELPDGQRLMLGCERFQAPEALFDPSLIGLKSDGLAQLAHRALSYCSAPVRGEMCQHMIVAGGSTMLPNLPERLKQELTVSGTSGGRIRKCYRPEKLRIRAPENRKCSAWIGGAVLASLSTFDKSWITMDDYHETGPSIIMRKCPR